MDEILEVTELENRPVEVPVNHKVMLVLPPPYVRTMVRVYEDDKPTVISYIEHLQNHVKNWTNGILIIPEIGRDDEDTHIRVFLVEGEQNETS